MRLQYPCPASEGWEARFATKVGLGGVGGAFTGAVLSLIYGRPLVKYALGTCGSFCIGMGCFSAIHETVRFLRCEESAVNSWIAGTGAGYLVTAAHQGKAKGIAGGVLWGGCGLAAYYLSERYNPDEALKSRLVAWDLLDSPTQDLPSSSTSEQEEETNAGWFGIDWWAFSPVQKMTHEELAEYRRKKKEEEEELKKCAKEKRAAASRVQGDIASPDKSE
ncbi:hypothetical protein BSKO_02974 [Bryopsis sp. KO-2023]|nr:hypothetical protein BSKO_02974 [Bryopsis sp. KO-2023]